MANQQGYHNKQQQPQYHQGYSQYPPAYSPNARPPAYGQQQQQPQVAVVYLPHPQQQGYNSGYPPPQQGYNSGYPPPQQGYNSGYPPPQQGYNTGYPPPQQGYNTGYPTQQGYPGPVYTTVQHEYPQQNRPSHRTGGSHADSPVDNPRQAGFGDYINISTIAYISDFEDPFVRQAFIRKVYSIVTVQLMFCFGWVFACVYVEPINTYLKEHPGILLFSYLLWMFMSVATVCCCWQAFTTHPTDMILLFVQTVIMSVLAGCFAVLYSPKVVLLAFATTIALMVLLTLFAFQTTVDLTQWVGVLVIAVIVVFVFAIFGFIVFPLVFGFYIPALHLVVACIMVVFTCGFIVIDTQMLMRNKTYSLSPHMYAFGAYQIFSDVIILFLYLLQLFQACNDS